MKSIFLLASVTALMTASLLAQSDTRATSRRPTTTPPVAPASVGPAGSDAKSTAGERPVIVAPEQFSLDRLKNNLLTIQASSQVSPLQKTTLKNDLMATVTGAVKPDPTLVQKLADSLAAALVGRSIPAADMARLTRDLDAVLDRTPAVVDPGQAIAEAKGILESSGMTKPESEIIVKDLQAIAKSTPSVQTAAPVRPQ